MSVLPIDNYSQLHKKVPLKKTSTGAKNHHLLNITDSDSKSTRLFELGLLLLVVGFCGHKVLTKTLSEPGPKNLLKKIERPKQNKSDDILDLSPTAFGMYNEGGFKHIGTNLSRIGESISSHVSDLFGSLGDLL